MSMEVPTESSTWYLTSKRFPSPAREGSPSPRCRPSAFNSWRAHVEAQRENPYELRFRMADCNEQKHEV